MKYVLIIGDGMADYPVQTLGGKTPLEVAEHPNMDKIISKGICGSLKAIPYGMDKGSDVAILSIMGYDPRKYHTGRGPLEAVAAGIRLGDEDIALRCNLITESDGQLVDYSADHITDAEAKVLINLLQDNFGKANEINFYSGVSYRHILVLSGRKYCEKISCSPPHDFVGKPIKDLLVKPMDKTGEKTANRLILDSKRLLSSDPVNLSRVERRKKPGNMMWPWSPGRSPHLQNFEEKYGVKGAVISAVNIVKGIGLLAGLHVIEVPGATGYFDTDYEAKADYGVEALKLYDMVVIHVEAPDEAGHKGDAELKVKTIEDLDRRVVGRLLDRLGDDCKIAVLPDHRTPISVKTHTDDPVPFAIYNPSVSKSGLQRRFTEKTVEGCELNLEGDQFMELFLKSS
jgi:2,3-bisphosphoglycerate-independent phosphoglycerate mutase